MSSYPYCDTLECKDKEYGLITSNVLELDFGKVTEYKVSGTKVISLKNTDTKNNAIIYSIVCLGNFEMGAKGIPSLIKPNQEIHIPVYFAPVGVGLVSGSIIVEQKNHETITIKLSGEGLSKETSSSEEGSGGGGEEPSEPTELDYWNEGIISYEEGRSASIWTPKTDATDQDIIISPKGNGSLHFSSYGNLRGNFAIDFQLNNTSLTTIAAGEYSVISGGSGNTNLGNFGVIAGGSGNTNQAEYGFIGSGLNNTLIGTYSAIAGGTLNKIGFVSGDSTNSFIGSGTSNTIIGNNSAIPSGSKNSITGNNGFIGTGDSIAITGNNIGVISGSSFTINGNTIIVGYGSTSPITGTSEKSVFGLIENTQSTTVKNSFFSTTIDGFFTNINFGFTGATNSALLSNSNYVINISGSDNTIDTSDYSVIVSGLENSLDNASASLYEEYENNYSVIIDGYQNKISSGKYSSIVNGEQNTINGVYHSTILGGKNNEILFGSSFTEIKENCFITGGENNSIQACNESAIHGGNGNSIDSSNNSDIFSGANNHITNSKTSSIISGEGNDINSAQYAVIIGGTKNKNNGIASGSLGGVRNTLSARNSVALGGEYGSDFGIKNHIFSANRDGIYWIKKIVAEDTGEATTEDAGNDLSVWVNQNSTFQKGEILLQKMPDPTQGNYASTSDVKEYLYTQSKKYQQENIWYDMPNNIEINTIKLPEYSCIFWDLDISLVDFEAEKFLKIHCNDGIISDTDNGLVIKQAHTTIVVGDESLVDIDITIEIDTENSLIRLLLPKEVKSYSGGAVFKYTVVTQGDTNFYWGN
jgi:hypothetical protein